MLNVLVGELVQGQIAGILIPIHVKLVLERAEWPVQIREKDTMPACTVKAFIDTFRKSRTGTTADAASGPLGSYPAIRRSRSRIRTSGNFEIRFLRRNA
jgi:hypothetical protein